MDLSVKRMKRGFDVSMGEDKQKGLHESNEKKAVSSTFPLDLTSKKQNAEQEIQLRCESYSPAFTSPQLPLHFFSSASPSQHFMPNSNSTSNLQQFVSKQHPSLSALSHLNAFNNQVNNPALNAINSLTNSSSFPPAFLSQMMSINGSRSEASNSWQHSLQSSSSPFANHQVNIGQLHPLEEQYLRALRGVGIAQYNQINHAINHASNPSNQSSNVNEHQAGKRRSNGGISEMEGNGKQMTINSNTTKSVENVITCQSKWNLLSKWT
jgi:hypothetical protein